MMTTICKLQKRNRYDYITEAVASYLKNEPILSFLPENKNIYPIKLAA